MRFTLLAFTVAVAMPLAARAAEFRVNTFNDYPDTSPGDGICSAGSSGSGPVCSLRAAIMEANRLGGPARHVIHLPAGVYELTRRGPGTNPGVTEDDRQIPGLDGAIDHDDVNDLDIGVDLEIRGAGEDDTIVENDGLDRVFHVLHSGLSSLPPRSVRMSGLTIRNGRSQLGGAGVYLQAVREAVFEDVTFGGNRGGFLESIEGRTFTSVGGGIYSRARDLFLTRCTLRNNFAVIGGGLAVAAGWATVRDTTIADNQSTDTGSGGPSVPGARTGLGGGIAILETPTSGSFLWMSGSTLSGNTGSYGGGLGAWGGFSITNSTISGNHAGQGGGAYVRTPGGAQYSRFEFTTLAHNTAFLEGGGVYREQFGDSRLAFARSLVADNVPENCRLTGSPQPSGGHNLQDGTTCAFSHPTDLSNTAPLLGPLRNNGGHTETHALLPLSPAVDRAGRTDVHVDQRGIARPYGAASDIGAYERSMPMLTGYPVPDRFRELFGFSVRLQLDGTSLATIGEIVPASSSIKLSVEIDKSGRAATVSAFGLKLNVLDLKNKSGQKQPVLFYVGIDGGGKGSESLVIGNQRFDGTLTGETKLPVEQK